jgi:hypothetical protein
MTELQAPNAPASEQRKEPSTEVDSRSLTTNVNHHCPSLSIIDDLLYQYDVLSDYIETPGSFLQYTLLLVAHFGTVAKSAPITT